MQTGIMGQGGGQKQGVDEIEEGVAMISQRGGRVGVVVLARLLLLQSKRSRRAGDGATGCEGD